MRKHNEGYVLPLVLVVMVILSLIAVGVMSVSLRNLQAQKADIDAMKAQYAAQGEVEILVTQLESDLKIPADQLTKTVTVQESQNNVNSIIKDRLSSAVVTWDSEEALDCCVTFAVTKGAVKIQCTLKLTGVIAKDISETVYIVNGPRISYEAYETLYTEEVASQ